MRRQGIRHWLRRVVRKEDGSVTVEMLVSVMVINAFLMAFYIWWETYNSHAMVDRVTYTVNDLITRQEGVTINRAMLDGLETTAEFILEPNMNAEIRFTQVTLQPGPTAEAPPVLNIDWSYSPCGALPMAVAGDGFDQASLPMMAVGSTMIVTDVRAPFISTFDLIPSLTFERRAVSLYRSVQRFNALEGDGTAACID